MNHDFSFSLYPASFIKDEFSRGSTSRQVAGCGKKEEPAGNQANRESEAPSNFCGFEGVRSNQQEGGEDRESWSTRICKNDPKGRSLG